MHYDYETNAPIFVYGSLRPGEGNYRRVGLGRFLDDEATAYLEGYKMLSCVAFPYIVNSANEHVTGTLLYPKAGVLASLLKMMDKIEGTKHGMVDDANHYNRYLKTVVVNGQEVEAWVYVPPRRDHSLLRKQLDDVPHNDWSQRVRITRPQKQKVRAHAS